MALKCAAQRRPSAAGAYRVGRWHRVLKELEGDALPVCARPGRAGLRRAGAHLAARAAAAVRTHGAIHRHGRCAVVHRAARLPAARFAVATTAAGCGKTCPRRRQSEQREQQGDFSVM